MCRNIRTLHNFDPPATREEVDDAPLRALPAHMLQGEPTRAEFKPNTMLVNDADGDAR